MAETRNKKPNQIKQMKKAALVFIPAPGMGHLVSTAEAAMLLSKQSPQLSITLLILKLPFDPIIADYAKTLIALRDSGVQFIELQQRESSSDINSFMNLYDFFDAHKPHVREILSGISISGDASLAGVVVDMICTTMIDVAEEFQAPSYIFYPSGAAMLGLLFHMQSLRDDSGENVMEYKNSGAELGVATYVNPVPAAVLPSVFLEVDGGACEKLLDQGKRYRGTKGILINTFFELESHAISALRRNETIPPVYPIGPLLNLNKTYGENQENEKMMIKEWLHLQPESSVVFLSFGTLGCFDAAQVKEIAIALERAGYRFLWALRRPPAKGEIGFPNNYDNLEDVLPEGFRDRTKAIGKVLGWVPQTSVLSHPAIGGFVSHCGWNSIIESVYFGVPLATWPIYSEQQANAFQMVKDLEMAVEIKMDFRKDLKGETACEILSAKVIESGIMRLMDTENVALREKVKEMKEKSRVTMDEEKGSSFASMKCFIQGVIDSTAIG